MTKQQRLLAFLALATLCALPVDATAGGFGLFKRCHKKKATCCAPPACQPCPPVACAPVASQPCGECETASVEPDATCWGAHGEGYDSNGNTVRADVPCTYPNQMSAIMAIYYKFAMNGWYLTNPGTYDCICIRGCTGPDLASMHKAGGWEAVVIVKDDPKNPIRRIKVQNADEAIKLLKANAGQKTPLMFHLTK